MTDTAPQVQVAAVELVGGPFCGDWVWWPVSEAGLTLFCGGFGYRYEVSGNQAIYKA